MRFNEENTPVIVGIGELTHRTKDLAQAIEPIELLAQALRIAMQDALQGKPGVAAGEAAGEAAAAGLLARLESIDIVPIRSWLYVDPCGELERRLGVKPARNVYGPVGGESPVRHLHEAALRIARGESHVAAVAGAESRYWVEAANKASVTLPWAEREPMSTVPVSAAFLHPVAVAHGMFLPITLYPLYENASHVAWGQTPREAMAESAKLWSRYSEVAATNPYAWLKKTYTPAQIGEATADNRMIAWPYTKHMVANPMVNMAAAVVVTSLGVARELGIPEDRLVYIWGGAKADEPRDILARDQFVRSHAQDLVMETILAQAGGDASVFSMLELYSCFPVVPKMARRTLGLAADARMTSTGGLSFFGAPLNDYMTHAAAGLVRALREDRGKLALLYGQGEFVTKHHALVLASKPPAPDALQEDYSVQAAADARRGPVPPVLAEYSGEATLETFTVVYERDGAPKHGVVVARTPEGGRLMARVDAAERASIAALLDLDVSPVGSPGEVSKGGDGLLRWTHGTGRVMV